MPPKPERPAVALDVTRLVKVLARHQVEYLMVGGAAALAYGARRPTSDADVLVRVERANLDRLALVMRELHARLAVEGLSDEEAAQLPVRLDGAWLERMEISTWTTDAGGFDVLVSMPDADGTRLGFEDLAPRASRLVVGGLVIRAASLDDIIASKRWANRPKDREALVELMALRADPGR